MADAAKIKPGLLYSVMCDDIRREHNGKLILIGLFEGIASARFPAAHPSLCIINCWIGGMGDFTQKTRILKADGDILVEDKDVNFKLNNLKAKHKVVAQFRNLRFISPGEYSIEVLLDGDLKIRYPLMVTKLEGKGQKWS